MKNINILLWILISQGNVVTRLRFRPSDVHLFSECLITNILLSVPVKEFLNLINIWRSYNKHLMVYFLWPTVYADRIRRQCIMQWRQSDFFGGDEILSGGKLAYFKSRCFLLGAIAPPHSCFPVEDRRHWYYDQWIISLQLYYYIT